MITLFNKIAGFRAIRFFRQLQWSLKDFKVLTVALVASNTISFFMYYSDYLQPVRILDYLYDLIVSGFNLYMIRLFIIIAWNLQPVKYPPRLPFIAFTLLCTNSLGIFIATGTYYLQLWLFSRALEVAYFTQDMVMIAIWISLLTLGFLGSLYWQQRELRLPGNTQHKPGTSPDDQVLPAPTLTVGNKAISLNQINGFVVQNKITHLIDKAGKGHVVQNPLQEVEKQLPHNFFRLNRQTIVAKAMIKSYQKAAHDKIEVYFHQPFPIANATISRIKAKAFKQWLQSEA